MSEVKHVAVIGAGAASLVALRHLTSQSSKFSAVAFGQSDNIDGTWVYTECTQMDDEFPTNSSMYKNLRTNIPKEIMAFPDFPFDDRLPSFIAHEDVLQYLKDYADHYNLMKYIQFKTCVVKILPLHQDSGLVWEVRTRKRNDVNNDIKSELFDAIMVCNGHYSVPHVPALKGMDVYTGQIVHSHYYRHPETYADKIVLCLGAGLSGMDICLDLAAHAKCTCVAEIPLQHQYYPAIKSLMEDTVILENGEELKVEVLLFCTGYKYSFPFLDPACGITTEGERVYPVYKHILHPSLPSLSFIGLCKANSPLPQFDLQVCFAIAVLDGSMKLPSTEEMEADIEEDYQDQLAHGLPHRYAHHLYTKMEKYNNMIADMAGVGQLKPVRHKLFNHLLGKISKEFSTYKKVNYILQDAEHFKEVPMT